MVPEMIEIRKQIDALDRELVKLLRARLNWVEKAGQMKADRTQVVDTPRIEEVIAKVLEQAAEQGLPTQLAERLWRLLIELSIEHEYQVFDEKTPK